MTTKKVTHKVDAKQFSGGTHREAGNKDCLVNFWLKKGNGFR